MKIAIFSDNFYPELSGISDSILLLAKELAKLGQEICFFVPRYGAKDYQAVGLPVEELELGGNIRIKRLFSLPATFAGMQARLVLPFFSGSLFKEFKPEIIHSQLFSGAGLEGWLRAKIGKAPLIGTNHTAVSEFLKSIPGEPRMLKRMSLKYSSWYYNQCDFVTAPSNSVFKEMSRHGFNRPHRVISNPIDLNIFSLAKDKAKFKKKFGFSENTVVYAGRLAPEKNIEIIIRAAALAREKIKNINLAIVGSGKSESGLKGLARQLNLSGETRFFGAVSKKILAEIYQAADIFSLASTSETQSLTLMQAMAAGLPAVVVNSRALPEYVNEQNGYVVEAGDYRAMAERFILLLENQEPRHRLGQGAFAFVQKFSAPNIAKEWKGVYEKAIENNKLKNEL